jgi:hypothetical protein
MLAKLAHTPERGHLALLDPVAQRGDALGGERAKAITVDTTELVVVQAARNKQWAVSEMWQGPLSHTPQESQHAPQGLDVALLDPLTQSSDALDGVGATTVLVATTEHVVVQTAAKVTSN